MDSANKQSAVIAEATIGTTPATPAFKVLRDIRVSGSPQRSNVRSPERRADRRVANMVTGFATFPKSIELPFARDAGTDILLESVLGNTWSADVLKDASMRKTFTLEERYEGGATDPYRRLAGTQAGSLRLSFSGDSPGTMTFGLRALAEATATTAIASSTYAAPSPGHDPLSLVGVTFNDLFGVSSPKVLSFDMLIENNLRDQHGHGSASPFGLGFGLFDISGSVSFYFNALADYSTFVTRQTGLTLDLTIGTQTNNKDRILLGTCDVWNPDVSDPGSSGDHMVTLNFMGKYDTGDTSKIVWTRNVA